MAVMTRTVRQRYSTPSDELVNIVGAIKAHEIEDSLVEEFNVWLAEYRNSVLNQAYEAIEAEDLHDHTEKPEDIGYTFAIRDALNAVEALKGGA